ncbi:unnamed protein product [Peniophora sp. CBMAI 1063]|nr:unnamed protein product [Peniophora sp. CBMAI 1063]
MAMDDEVELENANPAAEEEEGDDEEGEQDDAGDDEDDDGLAGAQPPVEDGDGDTTAQPDDVASKPKRKPKAAGSNQLNRQYGGKALLPITRVQKIVKADKWNTATIGRESTWLIARATEDFIQRWTKGAYNHALLDKHSTISVGDMAKVIRRDDEYTFLDEIIMPMVKQPPPRKAPGGGKGKKAEARAAPQGQSMLDGFVAGKADEGPDEEEDGDIVMDENGAMTFVPRPSA